jgi:NADH-quinone oxidoreductase subunit C
MKAAEIYEKLKAEFGEDILSITEEGNSDPFILVNPVNLVDIMLFLRDESDLYFDYLANFSGVDLKDRFQVVYNLYSVNWKHSITIKIDLPRENPSVATLEKVWLTADWHERETWDLLGINFEGHHNQIRILNPYDWEGFPLRKDYVAPEFYHGIKVAY